MVLRWILVFASLLGVAAPTEAQPQPSGFQFPAPAGWVRAEEGQISTFRPPAEPPGSVVMFVLPPIPRQPDFAAQFATLRAAVTSGSGLSEMRNAEEQRSGTGGSERRFHFATYSSPSGDLHLSIRARAEGNSVGTVVFMASTPEAYRRLQPQAAKVFDGMRLPGAAAPGSIAPSGQQQRGSSAGFRGPGLSGVWMASVIMWGLGGGMNTIELRWKTFFDDGVMFADLPNAGLLGFNRAAAQADPHRALSWHTYSFSGSAGETRRAGTPSPWILKLEKPNQLKIDMDTFYRCVSVDGLRLSGAWTSYANPTDPELDRLPIGQRPIIRFEKDGRFVEEGLFALLLTSADDRPGSGRYELRDFTLILRYDDGRVRHEAFTGFLGGTPLRGTTRSSSAAPICGSDRRGDPRPRRDRHAGPGPRSEVALRRRAASGGATLGVNGRSPRFTRSRLALRRVDVDACHAVLARHLLLGGALERIEPLADLDALEADVLEQPQELCLRQSAADSTGPQVDVTPYGFRQLRGDHDVRVEEATPRAEDPQHLGEGAPLVGREVQHAVRDDDVGGGALDREVEGVAAAADRPR